MDNLISRQMAIDALEESKKTYHDRKVIIRKMQDIINNLPSAQPETAKRIVGKSRGGMTSWYQCNICNEPVHAQDNFCSGCGRRLTDE